MKAKAAALFLVLATVLIATYMHDRAQRYEVVIGGGGGSHEATGDVESYLIDRTTGAVWYLRKTVAVGVNEADISDSPFSHTGPFKKR